MVNLPNQQAGRQARRELIAKIEAHALIRKIEFDSVIHSTVTVAGEVLYVSTEKTLYAIGRK